MSDIDERNHSPQPLSNGEDSQHSDDSDVEPAKVEEILTQYIREHLEATVSVFRGPFGRKQVFNCDYIDNGRSLNFIEEYLRKEVMPLLSNDPITTKVSGLQTTMFLDDSRNLIRSSVNATVDDQLFLLNDQDLSFGKIASKQIIEKLELHAPILLTSEQFDSNDLKPWLEIESEMVLVPNDVYGRVNIEELKNVLDLYRNSDRKLIGYFPAGSNVTGCLNEDLQITSILHQSGALAFWDYSAVAHNVKINMNPTMVDDEEGFYRKDGLFFRFGTLLGGLQTGGALIIKKPLLKQQEQNISFNETQIVSIIRSALVVQLKDAIGSKFIMEKQNSIVQEIQTKFGNHPNLILLGNSTLPRASFMSFVIRHTQTGMYLHQNYIVALLNDLFGIQSRAFTVVDNTFAQSIFKIDDNKADMIKEVSRTSKRLEVMVPGYTRLDIPWFISDEELRFVFDALDLIADKGWSLLPQYLFTRETGEWQHQQDLAFQERKCLSKINYISGKLDYLDKETDAKTVYILHDAILKAKESMNQAKKVCGNMQIPDQAQLLTQPAKDIKWFLMPLDAKKMMGVFKKSSGFGNPDKIFQIKKFKLLNDEDKEMILGENPIGSMNGDPKFTEHMNQQKKIKSWWLYGKKQIQTKPEIENEPIVEEETPNEIQENGNPIEKEAEDTPVAPVHNPTNGISQANGETEDNEQPETNGETEIADEVVEANGEEETNGQTNGDEDSKPQDNVDGEVKDDKEPETAPVVEKPKPKKSLFGFFSKKPVATTPIKVEKPIEEKVINEQPLPEQEQPSETTTVEADDNEENNSTVEPPLVVQ